MSRVLSTHTVASYYSASLIPRLPGLSAYNIEYLGMGYGNRTMNISSVCGSCACPHCNYDYYGTPLLRHAATSQTIEYAKLGDVKTVIIMISPGSPCFITATTLIKSIYELSCIVGYYITYNIYFFMCRV